LKVVVVIAGLTGGFFIEWKVMQLTEVLIINMLRSGTAYRKFFLQIAVKNMFILLILTLAAVYSITLLLSLSAGIVMCIFYFVLKKNNKIGKTSKLKGSGNAWKE